MCRDPFHERYRWLRDGVGNELTVKSDFDHYIIVIKVV
jgi:hypothetical protein